MLRAFAAWGKRPGRGATAAARRNGSGLPIAASLPVQLSSPITQRTNGLFEHEYGHIFFGRSEALPLLHPDEADDFRYESIDRLAKALAVPSPEYTP